MPITRKTRKQKRARKSRGLEILSDIENLDIMLDERHYEGEESVNSNVIRSEDLKVPTVTRLEIMMRTYISIMKRRDLKNNAVPGHKSASGNSNVEIKRLSSELNSRLPKEIDEMMSSVILQIQRAISHAISNQILSQIQNALRSGSGQLTQNRRNVPTERPEIDSEDNCCGKSRDHSGSEPIHGRSNGEPTDQTYDMVTGENESPIQVPVFLTGRMPSRSHFNQSHDDTTIPAQEKTSRERPKSAPYLRLKKTRKPLFLQLETTKTLKKLKIEIKKFPYFFEIFFRSFW